MASQIPSALNQIWKYEWFKDSAIKLRPNDEIVEGKALRQED